MKISVVVDLWEEAILIQWYDISVTSSFQKISQERQVRSVPRPFNDRRVWSDLSSSKTFSHLMNRGQMNRCNCRIELVFPACPVCPINSHCRQFAKQLFEMTSLPNGKRLPL